MCCHTGRKKTHGSWHCCGRAVREASWGLFRVGVGACTLEKPPAVTVVSQELRRIIAHCRQMCSTPGASLSLKGTILNKNLLCQSCICWISCCRKGTISLLACVLWQHSKMQPAPVWVPLAQLADLLCCSFRGSVLNWTWSDQGLVTVICLLEPWVTVPDPSASQKLELWSDGTQAGPSLSLAWGQPRSGGKWGTHLDVWVPCYLMVGGLDPRRQMPPSRLTYVGILVSKASGSFGRCVGFSLGWRPWCPGTIFLFNLFNQWVDEQVFPETWGVKYWKNL